MIDCTAWARRRMNDESMRRKVQLEEIVGATDEDVSRKRKRKKGPKKEVHRFGNYHHYYGYRLGKSLDEDPRLKVFEREWFEGKDCLDIGCNEGLVTISIAQKYNCRSILGLDIDEVLIEKAKCNLSDEADALQEVNGGGDVGEYESEESGLSGSEDTLENEWWKETIAWRELQASGHCSDQVEDSRLATESAEASTSPYSDYLLRRVTFRKENFIKDFPYGDYMKDGTFDTVLCLSMTKWVHLNWGDGGLVRLFAKIYHILRPEVIPHPIPWEVIPLMCVLDRLDHSTLAGGVFILEPQPWKSYKKKAHVCEVTRQFFSEIQLRPEHFTEILLEKIGFKSYKEVSTAVPGSTAGFDRSLFVYLK